MKSVSDANEPTSPAVRAVLCVAADDITRLGKVLRYLAVGLVDQAVQLRMLCPDPRIESFALGPVETLLHKPIGRAFSRRRLHHLCERITGKPPTVVHALSAAEYAPAAALANHFEADLVLQVFSFADAEALVSINLDAVGACVVGSEPVRQELKTRFQLVGEKTCLIRPGVIAKRKSIAFARYDRALTLVCTAPLERGAGLDEVVKALAALPRDQHDLAAFFLGRGPYEEGLRRLVRQHDLASVITFASPLGDLAKALDSADVFVSPVASPAIDVDALHAMAAGAVVITFPNPANDHCVDGQSAIVCGKPRAEELAEVLGALLADRGRARRVAAGGLEHVRQMHPMSAMADQTAALYRRLALARTTIPLRKEAS